MEINPGGILDPEELIGRDREIARYWKILKRQGLILSAERRIGKTSIVKKMDYFGHPGFVTFYQDLEKVHSILELVRSVYSTVSTTVSAGARLKGKFIAAWSTLMPNRIRDIEVPQAKDHWKSLLSTAIEDVIKNLEPNDKVVFIWDELPLMLYNIAKRDGAEIAIELLDVLRHLRQSQGAQLRFLFTGSVGLHLVLRTLRRAGNANNPINDMYIDTVNGMCEADSLALARHLLTRMDIVPKEINLIAAEITNAVQGFPYYVQYIVDQLDQLEGPSTSMAVSNVIKELMRSNNDPAHLGYFEERIQIYYDPSEKKLALAILDAIAANRSACTREQILNLVRHVVPEVEKNEIISTISLLCEDHYLTRIKEMEVPTYNFRWDFLKAWWKESRL